MAPSWTLTMKRKAQALLESLGKRQSTSLLNASIETSIVPQNGDVPKDNDPSEEPPAKRRPQSISSLGEASANGHEQEGCVSSKIKHKRRSNLLDKFSISQEADYSPWDRQAFLQRLKTYSALSDWTAPKPDEVNEVQWAKRGWVCMGNDTVRCILCNVQLLVKLNAKMLDGNEEALLFASDIDSGIVHEYQKRIVSAHNQSCLWAERGCDDAIFQLQLSQPSPALQGLRERWECLMELQSLLPYEKNICCPDDYDFEYVLGQLPDDFFGPIFNGTPQSLISDEPSSAYSRVALKMALFGWTHDPVPGPIGGSARCHSCHRTLALWLFRSKDVDEDGTVLLASYIGSLDLRTEHRKYCPWRNPESQSGVVIASDEETEPPLAAWQVLIRTIKNSSTLRQSANDVSTTLAKKDARATAQNDSSPGLSSERMDDNDYAKQRDDDDKKRSARLQKIRNLFNIKGVKKIGHRASTMGRSTTNLFSKSNIDITGKSTTDLGATEAVKNPNEKPAGHKRNGSA